MPIDNIHHFSFSVTDLNRTIEFYTKLLGAELQSKTRNKYETLGRALFGTNWGSDQPQAELMIAVMKIGSIRVEFIQYIDPAATPYHRNPSVAGSAHIAFQVDDIEKERTRLEAVGVEFHSPINIFKETDKPEWKWCYFRDPDGICLELVEQSKDI
jgi:catechol 2,3-dioxygenase-like lactoylglutathione lyase family enzyme